MIRHGGIRTTRSYEHNCDTRIRSKTSAGGWTDHAGLLRPVTPVMSYYLSWDRTTDAAFWEVANVVSPTFGAILARTLGRGMDVGSGVSDPGRQIAKGPAGEVSTMRPTGAGVVGCGGQSRGLRVATAARALGLGRAAGVRVPRGCGRGVSPGSRIGEVMRSWLVRSCSGTRGARRML